MTNKAVCLQNASWISTGGACSTPMFRGSFDAFDVKQARLTIAGLGTYECYINGKRVGEDLFLPLSTDFNARPHMTYMGHPFLEEMGIPLAKTGLCRKGFLMDSRSFPLKLCLR